MRASRTLVPGPSDPRELGVMFDRLTLAPAAVVFPPRSTLAAVAVAAGAFAAALALIGFSLTASVGGAIGIAAGISSALATGFAPFSPLPSTAMSASLWASVVIVAIIWGIEWRSGASLRNTARFAVVFSVCAALFKLLMLLHPNMPVGDALFHAHRYRTVVEGNLFFTSIAPGNYQFPYAPGLYVAATPFAALVSREAGDMTLLRIFAALTDGVAGGFLYLMIARAWGDRLAGAIAVALYHLTPLGFDVARTGNLTNAFAQSLAVFALVLIAHPSLRWERRLPVILLAVLLAAAFLSHTSTFAIVFPACVLIAGAFLWKGGPALRSPAAAVAVAALAALIASVGLYYGHFGETYRTELARIGSETASSAPDAGGRTPMDRLADVPRYLQLYFDHPADASCRSRRVAHLRAAGPRPRNAGDFRLDGDLRPLLRHRHRHAGRHAVLPRRDSRVRRRRWPRCIMVMDRGYSAPDRGDRPSRVGRRYWRAEHLQVIGSRPTNMAGFTL